MSNKEEFTKWVLKNLTKGSGAGPAYVASLDWLSEKFYKIGRIKESSIFNIEDIKKIKELHIETKKIQRDSTSFIYNAEAPSYGERYFYSASLNKYLDFLKQKNHIEIVKDEFEVEQFIFSILQSGLIFSPQLINRFIASLCTKPFVICSGLSGSGKTKLAQAFAQWITADNSQYVIVPVGADWTNREPLLGYPNALNGTEYVTPENGVLDLMIRAKTNFENDAEPTKPFFLILDEMNLSHVERYFADFLSTMESGDLIPLHKIELKEDVETIYVPQSIKLPKNLFIIGTVNIDETTYMFSPKVLDRANTIEFRVTEDDLKQYIGSNTKLDMSLLAPNGVGAGAAMAESFVAMATKKETAGNIKDSEEILLNFFNELKKNGAEFGYRTTGEIGRLMQMLQELGETSKDNQMDIAVMQKLLPKLHGSRTKLSKVLVTLGRFCVNESVVKDVKAEIFEAAEMPDFKDSTKIKYPLSLEKIYRMYKNAIENGFASYAEA